MKDVFSELRQAYYQQLNGLSVDGQTISCYDTVAPDNISASNFIVLSTQTSSQESNKHANVSDCTLLIDIVTKSTSSTGRLTCDEIANAVTQEILTADLSLTNFQLVTTVMVSNESLYHKSDSQHIYRRLIRYRHKVVEN